MRCPYISLCMHRYYDGFSDIRMRMWEQTVYENDTIYIYIYIYIYSGAGDFPYSGTLHSADW